MEQYYKIGDVEYSTNLDFFMNNQITTSIDKNGTFKVFSTIEPKLFLEKNHTFTISDFKDLHKSLLGGLYGQGILVN